MSNTVEIYIPLSALENTQEENVMTMEHNSEDQPFVAGRTDEMISLMGSITSWKSGLHKTIILSGSSGYGKSTLNNAITYHIKKNYDCIFW